MVVQKSIDNLKGRPEDERKVVAGGIAVSVVVVLLIIWGVFFFKKISSGNQQVNLSSGTQDQFNLQQTQQAQQQLQAQAQDPYNGENLMQLRDNAAANQLQTQQQTQVQDTGTNPNQFGGDQTGE